MNKEKLKKNTRNLPAYIICLAWTAFTFAIMIYIVCASFGTSRDIFGGTVFEFKNGINLQVYADVWKSSNLGQYFFNSLFYASVAVIGGVAISAPAAYVLARFKFRGREFIKRCLILAMSIPSIMVLLPIYALTIKFNIRGQIIMCLLYIFFRVPFTTTFLLSHFESISMTYAEAATIDGCPEHKVFSRIMLPMVTPAIGTASLLGFLGVLNDYFISVLMVSDASASSLGAGLNRVIAALKYAGDYPGIFAAVVIVMIPSIVIFALASKKIMYGNMGGGIKG